MKIIPITYAKRELKYPYFVTDTGLVYSEKTKHFLSFQLDRDGYQKVTLISTDNKRHRYSVHRLVLENFNPIENMSELQVNHKDGNKQNNNLYNLEWCTCSDNILHAYRIGLKNQTGEHNNASKLTEEQVIEMIRMYKTGKYNGVQLCKMFNVSDDYLDGILRGKRWKYLNIESL